MLLVANFASQKLSSQARDVAGPCLSKLEARASSSAEPPKIPFSVKDSIEISRIINPFSSTVIELRDQQPVGIPIVSPDQKHFVLISQRGVLATNTLEASIWLFDLGSVSAYASRRVCIPPVPIRVVRLAASSNTPVISNVRWLDSKRVAFLGKQNSPYQQLFITDIRAGSMKAVTRKRLYVTAYDIVGQTIAYTTLEPPGDADSLHGGIVAVANKDISSLMYPRPLRVADIDEGALMTYANVFHVVIDGRELPQTFTFHRQPLRQYIPTL